MLSPANFGRLFGEFERSAFRVELLAAYRVPEEAAELAAYVSDGPPPDHAVALCGGSLGRD